MTPGSGFWNTKTATKKRILHEGPQPCIHKSNFSVKSQPLLHTHAHTHMLIRDLSTRTTLVCLMFIGFKGPAEREAQNYFPQVLLGWVTAQRMANARPTQGRRGLASGHWQVPLPDLEKMLFLISPGGTFFGFCSVPGLPGGFKKMIWKCDSGLVLS